MCDATHMIPSVPRSANPVHSTSFGEGDPFLIAHNPQSRPLFDKPPHAPSAIPGSAPLPRAFSAPLSENPWRGTTPARKGHNKTIGKFPRAPADWYTRQEHERQNTLIGGYGTGFRRKQSELGPGSFISTTYPKPLFTPPVPGEANPAKRPLFPSDPKSIFVSNPNSCAVTPWVHANRSYAMGVLQKEADRHLPSSYPYQEKERCRTNLGLYDGYRGTEPPLATHFTALCAAPPPKTSNSAITKTMRASTYRSSLSSAGPLGRSKASISFSASNSKKDPLAATLPARSSKPQTPDLTMNHNLNNNNNNNNINNNNNNNNNSTTDLSLSSSYVAPRGGSAAGSRVQTPMSLSLDNLNNNNNNNANNNNANTAKQPAAPPKARTVTPQTLARSALLQSSSDHIKEAVRRRLSTPAHTITIPEPDLAVMLPGRDSAPLDLTMDQRIAAMSLSMDQRFNLNASMLSNSTASKSSKGTKSDPFQTTRIAMCHPKLLGF